MRLILPHIQILDEDSEGEGYLHKNLSVVNWINEPQGVEEVQLVTIQVRRFFLHCESQIITN